MAITRELISKSNLTYPGDEAFAAALQESELSIVGQQTAMLHGRKADIIPISYFSLAPLSVDYNLADLNYLGNNLTEILRFKANEQQVEDPIIYFDPATTEKTVLAGRIGLTERVADLAINGISSTKHKVIADVFPDHKTARVGRYSCHQITGWAAHRLKQSHN